MRMPIRARAMRLQTRHDSDGEVALAGQRPDGGGHGAGGAAPLEALYRAVVQPVATRETPDAWYREWRVMRLDGTTLDVADTAANREAFGRPASARGVNATGAFPQLRLVGVVETGTHVLCGAALGASATGEVTLAAGVVSTLTPDMLCLADRGFVGFDLWQQAATTGAALLWRVKASVGLPVETRHADGSYRSALRWNSHSRSADRTSIPVRVIEYTLPGMPDADTRYRIITTILDPDRAPATELAALYHERWEIETTFDEFKTHVRGAQRVLRSKTPELVRQEAWGFLLAHFALRALMHEAALGARPYARDPDTLSFTHAVRVARRTLPHRTAIPPPGLAQWHQTMLRELRAECVRSSRGRVVPRGVNRKMSNYPLRSRQTHPTCYADYDVQIVE